MSRVFSDLELAYLSDGRRLGRLATVGRDGTPHVTPVGMYSIDAERGTVDITGRDFARTKKFRDVRRSGHAALVVDDVLPPWRPRGVEVRGTAEAIDGEEPRIRLYPSRVVSWGLSAAAAPARSGPRVAAHTLLRP